MVLLKILELRAWQKKPWSLKYEVYSEAAHSNPAAEKWGRVIKQIPVYISAGFTKKA